MPHNAALQLTPDVMGRVPDHVPHGLVRPFSNFDDPDLSACPFTVVSRLHDGPDIFWSPFMRLREGGAGSWVVTRAEDIRRVLMRTEDFSSHHITGFSKLLGENWRLVPLEYDPPEHTKFRKVLNPILYPPVVAKMTPGVIARSHELLDGILQQPGCEFMDAFGRPFPVSIFLQFMGLPRDLMQQFLAWEYDLLHESDRQRRAAAAAAIREYLRALSAERRAKPTDDLASFVVHAAVEGRPWTDEEVMGALYLLFVGGLDTVASSLGWFFHHLATHPEQQQWLRDNPQEIGHAVEELLRRFSVVAPGRICTRDLEFKGIRMKQGDWVSMPFMAGSLDPHEFEDPLQVNFERKNVRHFAFAFGPHFCIGSHLARRELAVALETWLQRVPPWRLKPGSAVTKHGGGVFGIEHLELEWG